ncbi:hypothetical protein DRN43_02385 [Thermococci archaeon]|nr:MAG: hypothetical protein DRN41_01895 [Thermococci archaeon]RLF90115.1 MAG: hypothetical protein DRN43_02385 [Thermococci archaeon]
MPNVEVIKKRLIEAGADPQILDEVEDEIKDIPEDANFELLASFVNFFGFLEDFEKYKRKRVNITLAEPVYDLLKNLATGVVDAEGKPYPMSYFLEDIIVWVLKDADRFEQFLKETYSEEGEEDEDIEGETEE